MNIDIRLPKPHPGQREVLKSKARFRVLQCGRRWGKSLICMVIAITRMLKGESVAYVTPEFGLGKDFFREILKYIPESIIKVDNKSELYIELIPTGFGGRSGSLKFFSGEALDSFRGRKFHCVIIDEAAFIPDLENAWNTSIRPTLSDYQGDAIFISTPRGKNYFHSLYLKGANQEPGWQSFHYPSNTNPYFPPEEFEAAKQAVPEAQFNQEYLAIAGENVRNCFGTANIQRNTIKSLSTEPTVVYGIDVARSHDYTVIVGLDASGCMTYFDRFQLPWEQTKERIKQLPEGILKVQDATGVGEVLAEQLINECQNYQGFKFTTQSKPKIIKELINAVEKGTVKYNETTANEMSVFEYSISPTTQHISYNAMQGFTDDCVCALAIALHHKETAVMNSQWKLYSC